MVREKRRRKWPCDDRDAGDTRLVEIALGETTEHVAVVASMHHTRDRETRARETAEDEGVVSGESSTCDLPAGSAPALENPNSRSNSRQKPVPPDSLTLSLIISLSRHHGHRVA